MQAENEESKKPTKANGGAETQRPARSVGDVLRQAYDEAVGESIPDDLLDLLKKLD